MDSLQQQWNLWSKAQKIAYLQCYPLDVRMELLEALTFPETGREVRRGPEARYVKRLQVS